MQLCSRDQEAVLFPDGVFGVALDALEQLVAGGDVLDDAHARAGGPDLFTQGVRTPASGSPLMKTCRPRLPLTRWATSSNLPVVLVDSIFLASTATLFLNRRLVFRQRRSSSSVSSSEDLTMASLMFWWMGASFVAMKRVPMLIPQAPRASAPARPSPSAKPPEAMKGTFLRRAAEEDEVCDVGFADVAGALKAVDGEEVDAELLGRERVADGCAFVQDFDVGFFELADYRGRVVAGGFDDFDAFLDDHVGVGVVVRRHERGEERQVDGELDSVSFVVWGRTGFDVIVLHLRISLRRSSGVGCVSAVNWQVGMTVEELTIPRPPAFETAEASSAYPTHCIPPWTTGIAIPRAFVSAVWNGIDVDGAQGPAELLASGAVWHVPGGPSPRKVGGEDTLRQPRLKIHHQRILTFEHCIQSHLPAQPTMKPAAVPSTRRLLLLQVNPWRARATVPAFFCRRYTRRSMAVTAPREDPDDIRRAGSRTPVAIESMSPPLPSLLDDGNLADLRSTAGGRRQQSTLPAEAVAEEYDDDADAPVANWCRDILDEIRDPMDALFTRKVITFLSVAVRQMHRKELEAVLALVPKIDAYKVLGVLQMNMAKGLVSIDTNGFLSVPDEAAEAINLLPGSTVETDGHIEMATLLLSYLCDPQLEASGPCKHPSEWRQRVQEYPLLQYAAYAWGMHCAGCLFEMRLDHLTDKACKFWTTDINSSYGIWMQAYYCQPGKRETPDSSRHIYRYLEEDTSAIRQLSHWGLTRFVREALELPESASDKDLALLSGGQGDRTFPSKYLLKDGADIAATTCDGRNVLHFAAMRDTTQLLELIIRRKEAKELMLIHAIDSEAKTPLHYAAAQGNMDNVRTLLVYGAEVNVYAELGRTPLYYAAMKSHPQIVALLLENGANAHGMRCLESPLHGVCSEKKEHWDEDRYSRAVQIVDLLMEAGADPAAKDADGVTPLAVAAVNDHAPLVKALLKHYKLEDIAAKGRWGTGDPLTALSAAVTYGASLGTIEPLMKHARPEDRAFALRAALLSADTEQHMEITKYFYLGYPDVFRQVERAHGKAIRQVLTESDAPHRNVILRLMSPGMQPEHLLRDDEPFESSPLAAIARYGLISCFLTFIIEKTPVEKLKNYPWDDIWRLARSPNTSEFSISRQRYFLARRPEFNTVPHMVEALHHALDDGMAEAAAVFYLNKISALRGMPLPPRLNDDVDTFLHLACRNNFCAVVKQLIYKHKADVNAQNKDGVTPLMKCFEDSLENDNVLTVIKALLTSGADVTLRDSKGRTALTYALQAEWDGTDREIAAIELLLAHGAEATIETSDRNSLRPIDYACIRNMYGAKKLLEAAGAKMRTHDDNGRDLLTLMNLFPTNDGGRYPIIDELVEMGSDIHAKDGDGKTLFYRCIECGDVRLLRHLMQTYKIDPTIPITAVRDDCQLRLPLLNACVYSPAKAHVLLTSCTPEQRKMLIHGRSVDGKENTALHVFTKNLGLAAVRWLIAAGADVDAVDAEGRTPLFFASRRGTGLTVLEGGTAEAVTAGYYLLKAGADREFRNAKTGKTVMEAVRDNEWFGMQKAALELLEASQNESGELTKTKS
ncbi:LOW QUALITY PROTEIN: Tankyrase-1 [Drechslerella dactyloides]|uniref:Tankyrase-1 n=1 Tax=Drechslerella dactyloides TaxID=74499 RepID=A0AAD6IUT5_DREDA|nr:LOW QUALITY PROTEIN: Tankyrase-1 [Drechslerella dactyloides]